ncbi:hypothetical protein M0R45_029071 [Rubus argutus]|uniref:Uncharacterized protein n=1 Tax=Rubus argutus TaxID=59490 RepID=A0AAW1W9F5_RUBAR
MFLKSAFASLWNRAVLVALAGAGGAENESEIQRMETICNTTVTELLLTGQSERRWAIGPYLETSFLITDPDGGGGPIRFHLSDVSGLSDWSWV